MRQSTNRRWQPTRQESTLPLFDFLPTRSAAMPLSPPANRSRTSQAAARSIGHASQTIRERILEFLAGQESQGATAEEVTFALELRLQTVTARLNELEQLRLTVDSGRTRPTSSGRAARVVLFRESPPGAVPPGSSRAAGNRSSLEDGRSTPDSPGGSP